MLIISGWLVVPLGYSALFSRAETVPFAAALASSMLFALAFFVFGRSEDLSDMRSREAMMSVTLGWIVASAVGGLPFILSGTVPTFVDGFFEAMSGFTTTGATILADVDGTGRALLLWRGIMHWLGGMGIIVMTLMVLPIVGAGGFNLYIAEVPGLDNERMTPRVRQTAVILWLIYFALTIILFFLLVLLGMEPFDSIINAMGTLSTGGFSTHGSSIAHYASPAIEWVIFVFMYLAGINFALHFQALRGRSLSSFRHDGEFIFYTKMIFGLGVLSGLWLYFSHTYGSIMEAMRYSFFQTASFVTTTGFLSANYDFWPMLPQALLFLCLFMGGCAGSTAGGFKQMRIMILIGHAKRQITKLIHPRAVEPVRLLDKSIDERDVRSVLAFLGLYAFVLVVGIFLVALFEDDYITAISGAATALGNVGPAFNKLGGSYCFAPQSSGAKWIYSFLMLCGRLELFTVMHLFTREYWREGIVISKKGARS